MRSLACLLAVSAIACAAGPRRARPDRMLIGAHARHFAAPTRSDVAFRDSNPPPREMTVGHEAVGATAQFTAGVRDNLYVGGELEGGMLDTPGSSTAASYGVAGIDLPFAAGSIGGELASGWRTVRYSTETDDYAKIVIEPRVRAQVWLSDQVSLAATGGMTLSDQRVWMAGVSIGVHSFAFSNWKRD